MPTRVFADGICVRETEYAVRAINAEGDAISCDYFDSREDAIAAARDPRTLGGDRLAVAVEEEVELRGENLTDWQSVRTTILTLGDAAALAAGPWFVGEVS